MTASVLIEDGRRRYAQSVRAFVLLGFALFTGLPIDAQAAESETPNRVEEMCLAYETLVKEAIQAQGPEGLRVEFLTKNQVFIDGGCLDRDRICPMTDEEWTLAEDLVARTKQDGIATSFVPFGCP